METTQAEKDGSDHSSRLFKKYEVEKMIEQITKNIKG